MRSPSGTRHRSRSDLHALELGLPQTLCRDPFALPEFQGGRCDPFGVHSMGESIKLKKTPNGNMRVTQICRIHAHVKSGPRVARDIITLWTLANHP